MLSRNSLNSSATPFVGDAPHVASSQVAASPPPTAPGDATVTSVQDDVGRLVKVAAELFALIEAQVHVIEDGLTARARQNSRATNAADVKDEILQSASNLDTSLKSIRDHLSHQGVKLDHGQFSRGPLSS